MPQTDHLDDILLQYPNRQTFGGRALQEGLGALILPLKRQFWLICLIVVIGALSSLAYGRMRAPGFEATAVVQVQTGTDTALAKAQLTSPRNLLEMVMRHRLTTSEADASLGRAAVVLRQAIAVQDLTSTAGGALGLEPEVAGVVVSVLLTDADLSARIANDLAQQLLDGGNAGQFDARHEELAFYRREEVRLWQESSALRAELDQSRGADAAETALVDRRRLNLMQDQYLEVRRRLAAFEVEARLTTATQSARFSLLRRATATEAVSVPSSWMLMGVAGSLLLAVALALVLDRRYPGNLMAQRVWRMVDDPARPILGVPRFVFVSAVLVCGLIGAATLLR